MAINASMFAGFTAGDALADLAQAAGDVEMRSVSPFDIDEHPENRTVSPEKVDRLKESILKEGLAQLPAVRVSPQDETRYQHIAGWHRILAYRELYRETGDEKWSRIQVTVLKGCDDETARRLMWQTNLISSDLSPEERGRGYEVLADVVERAREEGDQYKGVRTNDVIADMVSAAGKKVSGRTVARARKALREQSERDQAAQEQAEAEAAANDDTADSPSGAAAPAANGAKQAQEDPQKAMDAEVKRAMTTLSNAIGRLEKLSAQGAKLPVESIKGCKGSLIQLIKKEGR